MNNYVTLDGFKYDCPFKEWDPTTEKPMSYRRTWDGSFDVTYGPGLFKTWNGNLRARVTPATGYGSISDLRATISKMQGVTFIDHYGDTYTVHIEPAGPEKSFSPLWSGASNVFLVPVHMIAEASGG